jgi:hypothetical protein
MAYSTIDKPSKYFNTVTYTGDGTTPRTLTGVGFKPDFSWTKRRDSGQGNTNHNLYNNVVGAGNNSELASNTTGAEGASGGSEYGYLSAFTSDGFTVADGTDATYKNIYTNNNGGTYCSWNWLGANTTVSNTSGSITSTVSANTTSGFSIVSYTGTGANATVGHGLGVVPKIIIIKNRIRSDGSWIVYSSVLGNTNCLGLNLTNSTITDSTVWNNTTPTSTVFTVGTNYQTNGSTNTMIAYCFTEVKGYSKFGSYVGNSSADGTFVYTGFKPAFIMIKNTNYGSGTDWFIFDNKRNTFNTVDKDLYANTSAVESTADRMDFLSNGFKLRHISIAMNNSSYTYIYMAFAENPFTSSKGIPCTAR